MVCSHKIVWIKFIGPNVFCSSNIIINGVNVLLIALFDIVKMSLIIGLLNWYFLLLSMIVI